MSATTKVTSALLASAVAGLLASAAHAAPLTNAMAVQAAPTGASAATVRSAIFICQTSPTKAATAIAR